MIETAELCCYSRAAGPGTEMPLLWAGQAWRCSWGSWPFRTSTLRLPDAPLFPGGSLNRP